MRFLRYRRRVRLAVSAAVAPIMVAAALAVSPATATATAQETQQVHVNQVGYLPHGPKHATVATDSPTPVDWQLRDAAGTTVAAGTALPRGVDPTSGQRVQSIDFSGYNATGVGYTLVADGQASRPFEITPDLYHELHLDALKFFLPQRSGIEIDDDLRPGYGRAAGHLNGVGDLDVPCQPEVCEYRLDVSGGWYDAGDHGKYVVNGGISVYQVMSAYERNPTAHHDGALDLPESGNGVPDILDEARWEMEFLLRMQVPAGEPLAGMAHHKVTNDFWTKLPLLPSQDTNHRQLHRPSTAATLNLAATAAQAARVFQPYDPQFAAKSLTAARRAWAAAQANPAMYAAETDNEGGGAYSDEDVSDEFYWAAVQLYLTTGQERYADEILASPHHRGDTWPEGNLDWGNVAQLGRLDLAAVPNNLPGQMAIRDSVLRGADAYLARQREHAYGIPYAPADNRFEWGSNSLIINHLVVLATAYDLSGDAKYRDGVIQGMDYLLGRNALGRSYVTGYGEVFSRNQHSRWYAHQIDPSLPHPPPGTLAGGPNSGLEDEVAQAALAGCAPQFCYLDDIDSWSTNELTVNWNSALAWVASFLADQANPA